MPLTAAELSAAIRTAAESMTAAAMTAAGMTAPAAAAAHVASAEAAVAAASAVVADREVWRLAFDLRAFRPWELRANQGPMDRPLIGRDIVCRLRSLVFNGRLRFLGLFVCSGGDGFRFGNGLGIGVVMIV